MPNRVGSVLHPSVIFKNPLGEKKKQLNIRDLFTRILSFFFPVSCSFNACPRETLQTQRTDLFPLENLGRLCVGALLSISFTIVLLVILDFEVLTAHLLQHY